MAAVEIELGALPQDAERRSAGDFFERVIELGPSLGCGFRLSGCMLVPSWLVLHVLASSPEAVVAVPSTRVAAQQAELGVVLSQVAAREVARLVPQGTRVVSADDVNVFLGAERQRALMGCETDSDCMTEIAAAMSASEIVSSSATLASSSFTGQQWVIEVKRVDGRTGARMSGSLITLCGDGATLLDGMKRAVNETYGKPLSSTSNGACPSGVAVVGLIGGVTLTLAGSIGTVVGLVTKSAWDAQQAPGAQPTVTRAEAQTAQVLFTGGLVAAGVGIGLTIASAVAAKPAEPQVAVVPLAGGALVSFGGTF